MSTSLRTSPIGKVVPISGYDPRFGEPFEAEAYVPDDLPDRLELPGSVWMAVTEAANALGRLDAAASLIRNPQLLTRVATRREAIGTSALEGTYANLTELFAAEALPIDERKGDVAPNVREVMNYAHAADAAYEWITERQITMGMLAGLQAQIVRGTDSDGPEAGAIRGSQVFIGAKNRRITDARFIPSPPGDQLHALCEQWTAWLASPAPKANMPLITRVAMAHYQFETLHPFVDANGRIGRLVAVLQMMREQALRSPVLAVSPWLKDHAEEYRDHLLAVSATGDWAPWVEFFAQAVCAEARSGHNRIMRLLALREELVETVRTTIKRAGLAIQIADDLIAYPILTVADAHRRYGRSNQANRDAILSLVGLEILEPYSEERYGRLYWNRRVFQIIEG